MGAYKNLDKRRATSRRFYSNHKSKLREKANALYEVSVWPKHLMKKYKLTVERYEEILQSQNGVCKITGLPPEPGQKLQVDHDHKTGEVRGLIRKEINKALGSFQDNPEWLEKAAQYLRGFKH